MRNLGINWPRSGGRTREALGRSLAFRLGWTVLPVLFAGALMVSQGRRLAEASRRAIELTKTEAEERRAAAVQEKRTQLQREIAALESKVDWNDAELLAEQYEWEAAVVQGKPWPSAGAKGTQGAEENPLSVPENIRAMIAIEPSEREDAQCQELAEYFRPYSQAFRELEAKKRRLRAEQMSNGR